MTPKIKVGQIWGVGTGAMLERVKVIGFVGDEPDSAVWWEGLGLCEQKKAGLRPAALVNYHGDIAAVERHLDYLGAMKIAVDRRWFNRKDVSLLEDAPEAASEGKEL